ncbi:MAG: hypothetical protein QMD13_09340 [Candidatus Bathyarchaeia archaeon]|nr:hypothetical protein [Candidatus Bathyarchaeia archaeon]
MKEVIDHSREVKGVAEGAKPEEAKPQLLAWLVLLGLAALVKKKEEK